MKMRQPGFVVKGLINLLIVSSILIAVLVFSDQIIKFLIAANFEECEGAIRKYYTFSIGDFDVFSLTHITNKGAGWSILSGHTGFLITFTAVIMLGLAVYMVIKRNKLQKIEFICFSFIIAGGIGNLIDRVRTLIEPEFNGVIDYIHLDFMDYPVFNFADICVVLGGIGICIYYIVAEIKAAREKKRGSAVKSDEPV